MKRALLLVLVFGIIACASPASLQTRAEKAASLESEGKWLEVYQLTSPRFREQCASGEFVVGIGMAMVLLRGFMGLNADSPFTFQIVRIEEGKQEARVFMNMLYRSEVLDFGGTDRGERWVFDDGQWWMEPEDMQEGCGL